jgi:hypothetical protein
MSGMGEGDLEGKYDGDSGYTSLGGICCCGEGEVGRGGGDGGGIWDIASFSKISVNRFITSNIGKTALDIKSRRSAIVSSLSSTRGSRTAGVSPEAAVEVDFFAMVGSGLTMPRKIVI